MCRITMLMVYSMSNSDLFPVARDTKPSMSSPVIALVVIFQICHILGVMLNYLSTKLPISVLVPYS